MLVGLFAILFLGGSSYFLLDDIEIVQDRVEDAIVDVSQRDRAKDILGQMEDVAKERKKLIKDMVDQLSNFVDDPVVSDPELDALMADYWAIVEVDHRTLIELRFDLKEHVTRDEWQILFKAAGD